VPETDVFIVAAEPSGDQLGANLARSLKAKKPDIHLKAIGGPQLTSAGLSSQMDIEGLAILGFVEGLKAYRFVLRKVQDATALILDAAPKAVVLIDSWGFMVRVAKSLKARGFKGQIIKYVAPQVWAMRSGRAKVLAQHVDHLLSTQIMDAPYFEAVGLPQTFVGNPVLDTPIGHADPTEFLKTYNLCAKTPVVGFFPGSRPGEIESVGPAIKRAVMRVITDRPEAQLICIVSASVKEAVERLFEDIDIHLIPQSELDAALSCMDAALACSGTITTQLAAAGVPTVVIYKLNRLTFFIAQRLFKPNYISLVNISADMAQDQQTVPLMPEFMQEDIFGTEPIDALLRFIDGGPDVAALRQALKRETQRMSAGSNKASDRAASAILDLI
jgi:lipid-A-disaccharide synthase